MSRNSGAPSLASVAAVDPDVAFGEIARVNARSALAETEVDRDRYFAGRHRPGGNGFVVTCGARTLFCDQMPSKHNLYLVAIRRLACLSNGHHDTAPIGIAAGDCRFHQR